MAFSVSDVIFSCAAYIGEYTEGYFDNKLSQKNEENHYVGKEFYAEGTVKNGSVSFENMKVDVDGDNYVTTWLHLHEIAGKAGYESVPIDFDGNPWNDYAEQCPYCQITGVEVGNLDIEVNIYFGEKSDLPYLGYYCCTCTDGEWSSYDEILEAVNIDVPNFEAEMRSLAYRQTPKSNNNPYFGDFRQT